MSSLIQAMNLLDTIPEETTDPALPVGGHKKLLHRFSSRIIDKVIKRKDSVLHIEFPPAPAPFPALLTPDAAAVGYTLIDADLAAYFKSLILQHYRAALKHESPLLPPPDLDRLAAVCHLTAIDSRDEHDTLLIDFHDRSWALHWTREPVDTAIARQKWCDANPDFRTLALVDYTPTPAVSPGPFGTPLSSPLRETGSRADGLRADYDGDDDDADDDDWYSTKESMGSIHQESLRESYHEPPEEPSQEPPQSSPHPEKPQQNWTHSAQSISDSIPQDLSYIEYTSSLLSSTESIISSEAILRDPSMTPISPVFPQPPVGAFYDVVQLNRLIIQCGIKQLTSLECIPTIHSSHLWLDSSPEIINRMPCTAGQKGLSWILEDAPLGVPVNVTRSPNGTDKIFMLVDGISIPLTGRKKHRFLEDLAIIQVAFSTVTSPHLGPLSLVTYDGANGLFIPYDLDDRFPCMTADIIPTAPSVETFFFALLDSDKIPPFLKYLGTLSLAYISPRGGPYPLLPPTPLWTHVRVCPHSGGITHLREVVQTRSVPWEVAGQVPLALTPRSRDRYVAALRKGWAELLLRKGDEAMPRTRLDQVANEELVECLLKMEGIAGDEERKLEERMVCLLFGTKDAERRKAKWEKERNMI